MKLFSIINRKDCTFKYTHIHNWSLKPFTFSNLLYSYFIALKKALSQPIYLSLCNVRTSWRQSVLQNWNLEMVLNYTRKSTYNPSVRIIDLVSRTIYVVCVNFILKWRDLQSTLNDRFFEKLFMAILFTLGVYVRNLLIGNRRRNTFCILFWCLAWDSNPGFSSNKPTHQLDQGDSMFQIKKKEIWENLQ